MIAVAAATNMASRYHRPTKCFTVDACCRGGRELLLALGMFLNRGDNAAPIAEQPKPPVEGKVVRDLHRIRRCRRLQTLCRRRPTIRRSKTRRQSLLILCTANDGSNSPDEPASESSRRLRANAGHAGR